MLIDLVKGDTLSHLGEFRLPVNTVPLVNYTGWTLTGEFVDHKQQPVSGLSVGLTVVWLDITIGLFSIRMLPADTVLLKVGFAYYVLLDLFAPGGDKVSIPRIQVQVVAQ
jgi:hypothetical protein